MINYLNKICPVCGGNVVLLANGTELCEKCHYVLPGTNWAESDSATSAEKYYKLCNNKLEPSDNWWDNWWSCPKCGYISYITTGDPPELAPEYIKEIAKQITDTSFYIPSGEAIGIASVQPQTLTITNCEKFKVQLREIDLEFELEPDKLENIDTLIINGYKYVKEK